MHEPQEKMFNRDLTYQESYAIMKRLASPNAPDQDRVALLDMIHRKGVTAIEMAGFSAAVRDFASIPPVHGVSDIVGTGGDLMNTINVSTAAAITASAMGIKMAKHGNRAVTGKIGSADFLSRIGYRFEFDHAALIERLNRLNFAFLLAPQFNGTFRMFTEARKKLPFKTVFNYLGPVTNPADPECIVIGSSDSTMVPVFAGALKESGKKGAVVISSNGMDEVSPFCHSRIMFVDEKITEVKIDPESITGISMEIHDIASSDPEKNFNMTLSGLRGEDNKIAGFIALNTAPLLVARNVHHSFSDAYEDALETIMSGKAMAQVSNIGRN